MDARSKKNADDCAVDYAKRPRRRGGQWFGDHDEAEEEKAGMRECFLDGRERIESVIEHENAYDRGGEECQHEVEALNLACDKQTADEHEREHRQVAADPPACVLAKHETGQHDRKRSRIKNMLLINGKNIFRCHCENGGCDQKPESSNVEWL